METFENNSLQEQGLYPDCDSKHISQLIAKMKLINLCKLIVVENPPLVPVGESQISQKIPTETTFSRLRHPSQTTFFNYN
jgi:hypothetical protein